ncbi:MAG: hypothetical protein AAF800_03365 [Planctomycetota bacterium]
MPEKPGETTRFTSRQAAKVIHDIRRERRGDDERRADQRLRAIAGVSVLIMLVGLFVVTRLAVPYAVFAVLAFGVAGFGYALFAASALYRRHYRAFVLEHMTADGTFLFCPRCKDPLGEPGDPELDKRPPLRCLSCGARPWRFSRDQVK